MRHFYLQAKYPKICWKFGATYYILLNNMTRQPDQTPLLDAMQNQLQIEFATSETIDTKALSAVAGNLAILILI